MTPEELKESIKQNQESKRNETLEALPDILTKFNLKLSLLTKENEVYFASADIKSNLDADLIIQEVCKYYQNKGWNEISCKLDAFNYQLNLRLKV